MSEIIKNITVVLCVVLCLAGGVWAWWVENSPTKEGKNKSGKEKDDVLGKNSGQRESKAKTEKGD